MPFAVEPSVEISHRADFSLLANARGYRDAVEVGVDMGVFAREFMGRFAGHWLYGIDHYGPFEDAPDCDRTVDMMVAIAALMPWHGRFRLIRGRSPDVIPMVRRFISPSFVYVDGSHDEPDVWADLCGWWDVLPPDGMLAGHDYHPDTPGVIAAVDRFAEERELVVRLTHETATPPSWSIYRTEPATLHRLFFDHGELVNPHAGET
jgi:hypothetical protein